MAPTNNAVDKLAGAMRNTDDRHRDDQWQKAFLKILDHCLPLTQLPTEIHEQSKLSKIRGLEGQVDDRQLDPSVGLIQAGPKSKVYRSKGIEARKINTATRE